MLRALGLEVTQVLSYLGIQAMTFSIPAIIMGLFIASILSNGMLFAIYYTLDVSIGYGLTTRAKLLGLF